MSAPSLSAGFDVIASYAIADTMDFDRCMCPQLTSISGGYDLVAIPDFLSERIFSGADGSVISISHSSYHNSDEILSILSAYEINPQLIFVEEKRDITHSVFSFSGSASFLASIMNNGGLDVEVLYI